MTRDSVLALAREHIAGVKRLPELSENLVVSERLVTMKEVKAASQSGRLVELFGTGDDSRRDCTFGSLILGLSLTGTAAVVSPVDKIGYLGEDVHIPTDEDGMGPVSRPLWKELVGRQNGVIPSDWSVVVSE